ACDLGCLSSGSTISGSCPARASIDATSTRRQHSSGPPSVREMARPLWRGLLRLSERLCRHPGAARQGALLSLSAPRNDRRSADGRLRGSTPVRAPALLDPATIPHRRCPLRDG